MSLRQEIVVCVAWQARLIITSTYSTKVGLTIQILLHHCTQSYVISLPVFPKPHVLNHLKRAFLILSLIKFHTLFSSNKIISKYCFSLEYHFVQRNIFSLLLHSILMHLLAFDSSLPCHAKALLALLNPPMWDLSSQPVPSLDTGGGDAKGSQRLGKRTK